MKTPDITPAQIVALIQPFITATIGLLVAFGIDMTEVQQTAILGFTAALATIVSTGLFIADAVIRAGRARVAAAQVTASSDAAIVASQLEADKERPA